MSVFHLDDLQLGAGDALIVTDVQNDFLPGGSLAVAGGDEIIPVLNHAIERFVARGLPVVATRDWHPADHLSFRQYGGPWPPHCIQGTPGAQFSPELRLPPSVIVISKATRSDREAYSAFLDTELEARLRERGAAHLFIGGLATDYCVLETTRDALDLGFRVSVIRDAVRAVEAHPGDGQRAIEEMLRRGGVLIEAGPHRPQRPAVAP